MIPLFHLAKKNVAVLGLGPSGLAVVKSLQAGGANILAWDDDEKIRQNLNIELTELANCDFKKISVLVVAPAIPLTHEIIEKARSKNVAVVGDMELFAGEYKYQNASEKIIAITGTNGKSTTTALLSHILHHAGWNVQMGGNIGKPILELECFAASKKTIYVLECSSYQIEIAPSLSPYIGVLLNITPDHIDRHGTFENYRAIKENLLKQSQHKIRVDKQSPSKQNIAAVHAVCRRLGVENIEQAIETFTGLAHRMQKIGTINNVLFINDSKATNAEAVATALESLVGQGDIYWLAGGVAKQGGIESLADYFSNISKAYFFGEAGGLFQKQSRQSANKLSSEVFENLHQAVLAAANDSFANNQRAIILFSPACASFDQFKNFEIRGKVFCDIFSQLKEQQ